MITISNKVCDKNGETTDCHREGIHGRCGLACPVLLAGYCEVEEVMYEEGSPDDNAETTVQTAEDN